MKLGLRSRLVVLVVGALVSGVGFFVYEQLRRSHRNDFPFLFEPLFLNGLLLVAIGVIGLIMIKVALTGGRASAVVGSLLIGIPSVALAVAPYLIVVLEWDFVPDRLVGDGFHQIGMLGIGAALAVLVLGLAGVGSGLEALDSDVG